MDDNPFVSGLRQDPKHDRPRGKRKKRSSEEVLDDKVVNPEDFIDREEVSFRDQIEWVFSRLDVDASDLEPSGAPSAGAWSLLKWARINRKEFIQNIWHKAAAKDQSGDQDDRAEVQQARKIEAIIEIIERVHKKAGVLQGAERPAGKPGVP